MIIRSAVGVGGGGGGWGQDQGRTLQERVDYPMVICASNEEVFAVIDRESSFSYDDSLRRRGGEGLGPRSD